MTYPENQGAAPRPEDELLDLLPQIAENFTPQLGYRMEITDVLLSDLAVETDYKKAFDALVGTEVNNTATLAYTYNAVAHTIDIETIRLGLRNNVQGMHSVVADNIYLQRYRDGFIQSFGLGSDSIAPGTPNPTFLALSDVEQLLNPLGMYTISSGDELAGSVANLLSNAPGWKVREQQTIPLPPDNSASQKQLILTRTRAVEDTLGLPDSSEADRQVYSDDYEVTFQTIYPSQNDPNLKPIEEVSLLIRHTSENGLAFTLTEKQYDRYEHPLVIGLPEILNPQFVSCEPDSKDIAAFTKLLEDYAA